MNDPKRVVFLPYKLHQQYNLSCLAHLMPVTVMLPPEKTLPAESLIEGVRINYLQFGAHILKKIFRLELRTLKYVKGLPHLLNKINIHSLITYEFYHWYTFQCIAYKKQHPDIKLFIMSETQRLPKNIVANIFKRLVILYLKLNLKHINGIFVYTDQAYQFTKKYLPQANVVLLPTPIDIDTFKPTAIRQFCNNGELRLLMNARFSPYKRYGDLFDAIAILAKEGKKVKITCISRYRNDREKIIQLARQKGIECITNVIDPLPRTEMAELYKSHDVLVLPSYNEAIGLVVPEAMACGTPTITSDTVGANMYVRKGETGLIFKTGDINELANCIKVCFDTALLARYSQNAVQQIHSNFTPEKYTELFKRAIN